MSDTLTEADVAAQFGGESPEAAPAAAAEAWLADNEPAPEQQFDIGAAVAAGIQEHLAGLAADYAAAQEQQQANDEYQAQVAAWLAEAEGDPNLYADRLAELRLDAVKAEIREELAPLYQLAERAQAQQAAELQNAINEHAAVTAIDVFGEEREQLGVEFDMDQAWTVAEQITSLAYGDLFTRGHSPQEAEQILREANFAEAALRSAARMVAGNAEGHASAPAQQQYRPMSELEVARRFVESSQRVDYSAPPRSPSEAIRAVQASAAFNPYGPNNQPTSELEVARRFMDSRRGALV